ncbi:helix-turn-helix domain-containing protein [Capnocytophaga gingivalis]|uniref:Helix-turn-helix domain-containing protein n=1 Tax=Capnocytophaga gingivalis TaxID=1017 RepID=A0ABU5Z8K9_9FLAO|nr:helix-turn-helix domain-containing protein [Capnocytophaga gingivalis]MEB3074467.1 helix-turn-helix domain-containing protein [Capnocytophaga gingivalis]
MKERTALLQMMEELFRRLHHLSPMAAKILSVLAIEGSVHGLTFEDLIERLQASKSTISTNINLLLDKELIYYVMKEKKRRKYFKSFPFDKRFEEFLGLIRYEKDFTMRFQQYMKAQNENEHLFTEERIHKLGLFLDYLSQIEHLTQDFLKKLKQEEISEKP